MKVKCVRKKLLPEHEIILKDSMYLNTDTHTTIEKEYYVYGISFNPIHGLVIWYITDYGRLGSASIHYFEIVEPTPSMYWEIRINKGVSLTLYPPLFYTAFFLEDLADGEDEAIESFKEIITQIEG